MLIGLPNGEYAFGMPVLRCPTCREDRPTMTLGDGKHVCAVCLRPVEPLSPVERFLSANGVAAIHQATRAATAATSDGTGPTPAEETGVMFQPTEEPVNWRALHRGDVIVRHPEHPDIPGEWPFIVAVQTGGLIHIHAGSEYLERTFHVYPEVPITVRHTDPPNGGEAA